MKRSLGALPGVMVMLVTVAGLAFAAEYASVEKGRSLFNDRHLGTNGKSCNDCHPDGKNLEKAGSKKDIEDIINGCITQALQGKPLDVKSPDMQSLVLLIKSFEKPGSDASRKSHVGC